jgi:ABC-type Fe3+-siderophore transport system permease subunit
VLKISGFVLGVVTVILGLNEATADVLDQIGSNYWLAYCAIISGIAIIVVVLILSKRSKK